MLVKFTDIKGAEVWINPVHVKVVRETKKGTEILMVVGNPSGLGGGGAWSVKTETPVDEAAAMLNAAMPDLAGFAPEDESGVEPGGSAAAAMLG